MAARSPPVQPAVRARINTERSPSPFPERSSCPRPPPTVIFPPPNPAIPIYVSYHQEFASAQFPPAISRGPLFSATRPIADPVLFSRVPRESLFCLQPLRDLHVSSSALLAILATTAFGPFQSAVFFIAKASRLRLWLNILYLYHLVASSPHRPRLFFSLLPF
jgi:hypothetical protein